MAMVLLMQRFVTASVTLLIIWQLRMQCGLQLVIEVYVVNVQKCVYTLSFSDNRDCSKQVIRQSIM